MIIETDTHIYTLLTFAEKIHDELEEIENHPPEGVTEEMQEAIREYHAAFEYLGSTFTDARRQRNNV